jgi:hypothetical protein
MSQYWFESLGDCFAQTSSDIEEQAEKIIRDEWNLLENGHWGSDERACRGLFRDTASYHSHGSYPRVDNLNFYLSYHAMMTVAGKLLADVPLHQDPDDAEDGFANWLSRHGLSRGDGNWLADRRDPAPLEWPAWKDEKQEDEWRSSVTREDFERILGLSGNRLNLWGHWSVVSGNHVESIHVSSALVSPGRSNALLRALQTASNPHDYRIPDANDDLQIDSGAFLLKGWVVDRDRESGLDKFDPWAGDIRCPPIIPAQFVRALMQVDGDAEHRVWRRQDDRTGKRVLWSQIWGCHRDKDDETEGERGKRLQASFAFVTEFLEMMRMDLIVEVEIQREVRRARYENRKEEGLGYILPAAKLFVIKSDGGICAL